MKRILALLYVIVFASSLLVGCQSEKRTNIKLEDLEKATSKIGSGENVSFTKNGKTFTKSILLDRYTLTVITISGSTNSKGEVLSVDYSFYKSNCKTFYDSLSYYGLMADAYDYRNVPVGRLLFDIGIFE